MSLQSFSYQREVLRKIIHLSSSLFSFMLLYLGKEICLPIFLLITMIFLLADYMRIKNLKFKKIYNIFFKIVTRPVEENYLTGATHVFLSILIITILFDVKIACASLLIMSFSDSAGALVGRYFGKFKILDKSLEGSISFFIVSVLVLLSFNFSIDKILYVSLVCTVVELLSSKIKVDDNFSVPLSAAVLLTAI
tara:strand:- start:2027 stop:2608 length:582 start_codon:yes stop_codon:yes gene_type:complete